MKLAGVTMLAPPFDDGTVGPFDPSTPITIHENMDSRRTTWGPHAGHVRSYVICGTADPAAALRAIETNLDLSPEYYIEADANGFAWSFIRETGAIKPILNADPPTMWHCDINYVLIQYSNQPRNTGESVTTFAIGEETVNVKMALEEINTYCRPDSTEVFHANGVINIGPNGTVHGVDITVPTFKFTRLIYKANAEVTDDYIFDLQYVAAKPINDAPFLEWDAGEVKFLGVSGTRRNKNGDWELNFEFAESDNQTDAAPNSGIPNIVKKGWEYLWFVFETILVDAGGGLHYSSQRAKFAIVDELYFSSDFSLLQVPPQ